MRAHRLIIVVIMVLACRAYASDIIYLGILDMHADRSTLLVQWFNPSSTVCMMIYFGPGPAQRRIGLEFRELWKEDKVKIDQAKVKLNEILTSGETRFTIEDFSKRLGLTFLRTFPIGERGL